MFIADEVIVVLAVVNGAIFDEFRDFLFVKK